MAENDAKKKRKMIGSATDHHQKEGDSDDSVNQADPGDSSIMMEDDAEKENLKMMSSISYHLQKDGGDDSSRLALMNAINSTPKKRKEPTTTTTETPSKIRKEEHWTEVPVKIRKKEPLLIDVKVPKKETKTVEESSAVAVGGAAFAAGNHNSDSDSESSNVMLIYGKHCSSPTTGLLPKAPPETDGKN
ncbi:hypothetical protein QL285_017416 [Trifolium repens]|nr:hypothetical protein QL285_017416 [Trifolium repens]